MKRILKLTGKALLASLLLSGGVALAADAEYTNVTLDGRLYQHDTYGAQWALDTGSDGLWFVAKEPVGDIYNAPLKIRNDAAANTLVVGGIDVTNATAGYVGIGTDAPAANLDVQWSGSNTVSDGLQTMVLLSADNSAADKASDAGFAMVNKKQDFQWNFRTLEYRDAFTATKEGSGGGEFVVQSPTNDFKDAIMKVGGKIIFEGGHVVTASSRELKTDIKPLDTQAAMDAFHKLQPVSYVYKTHKDEPVVGFIAEDIPELVAMPSRKTFDSAEVVAVLTKVVQEQDKKIQKLEAMQKRLTRLETLLTNLALETSKEKQEKLSLLKK